MEKFLEILPEIYKILEDILLLIAILIGLGAKHDVKKAVKGETIDKIEKSLKIKNTKNKDKILKILQRLKKEDVAEIIKNYMEVEANEEKKTSRK